MEAQLNRILVGFDFSPQSHKAVRVALSIGAKARASVMAVSVLKRGLAFGPIGGWMDDKRATGNKPPTEAEVLEHVRRNMEEEFSPLQPEENGFSCCAVRGKPFQKLVDVAQERGVGLIVVGATGAGHRDKWVLGSTAERLARRSPVPVLIVKADTSWPPRRIVCPVDFAPVSKRTASWGAIWGRFWKSPVELLHVIVGTDLAELQAFGLLQRMDVNRYLRTMESEAAERMRALAHQIEWGNVPNEAVIAHGRPHEVIIERTKAHPDHLVMMGSLGRDGVKGMLIGNTAERVMRRLACPLLIQRHTPV